MHPQLPLLIAIGVGLAFGFVFGCGNRSTLVAAILPTLFFCLLAGGYWIREREWTSAGVAAVACLLGALICWFIPQTSGFKRFVNGQHNLHIKLGSYYEFGRDPAETEQPKIDTNKGDASDNGDSTGKGDSTDSAK